MLNNLEILQAYPEKCLPKMEHEITMMQFARNLFLFAEKYFVTITFFMSYPGHSLGNFYLNGEIQSEYTAASADWANLIRN